MLTVLFWNLHNRARAAELVVRAVVEHNVDVVVVAECSELDADLERLLCDDANATFRIHSGFINERIRTFTKGPVDCGRIVFDSAYLAVWPLHVPQRNEVLLATMHAVSRRDTDLLTVNEEVAVAAEQIRAAERARGHDRTLLLGDFNLNPFDEGMARARALHGVMSQATALEGPREVKFREYPIFYNPMWSRIGDFSPGPCGTYYYYKSGHLNYYWHTYDQVLIRPSLLGAFRNENLRVLDRIERQSLLDQRGRPNSKTISDHLPILLRMDL